MMSILGANAEDIEEILKGLGYRSEAKPAEEVKARLEAVDQAARDAEIAAAAKIEAERAARAAEAEKAAAEARAAEASPEATADCSRGTARGIEC